MKVVILCGGYGTRISEESYYRPKPMIEIGDKPILWHIMKIYSAYGFNEFIICAGYKQHIIKDWFADYFLYNSDVTFDFTEEKTTTIHNSFFEPWKVTIVDTGLDTMTGGRVKRVRDYLGDEPFFLTYGDGVSDVDVRKTLEFHKKHGKIATITAVRPEGRFGVIDINGDNVVGFREKSKADSGWINGGFMVLDPKAIDYIADDHISLEREPLETIAKEGQLMCYKHDGFWHCMDTVRDKQHLEKLLEDGNAPWVTWKR